MQVAPKFLVRGGDCSRVGKARGNMHPGTAGPADSGIGSGFFSPPRRLGEPKGWSCPNPETSKINDLMESERSVATGRLQDKI